MGHYGITGWSAGARRPLNYGLKAGQFRGMGRVNYYGSNTTIINNNFFGARPMAPGPNFATMNYCEQNTGLSKGEKWLLRLGAGTSILGTILGFFGLGGNKSAEGAGSAPADNTPAPTVEAQAAPQVETTPETEETPETEPEEKPQDNKFASIKNGAHMVCRDASGKTANISGTLSNVQTDANGVPTSFTLTDETSGNQYNYTVQVDGEGNITYQCTSKNGQATIGAPAYTFQNGELVNLEGQNGYGIGIRTAQAQSGTPAKRTAPAPNTQQQNTNGTELSYEAEQYFNEHPYQEKNFGTRKVYVSEDGRLMGNSPKQLYDMIQQNEKLGIKSGSKTQSTPVQKYDLNGFANAIKAKGINIKNVTGDIKQGWTFHITDASGKSTIKHVQTLDSNTLASITE